MLNYLKEEAALGRTENGAVTLTTSGDRCLDLFFRAGAIIDYTQRTVTFSSSFY